MNYLTILGVVLFCLFILMFVGSSKDNKFEAEILKVAPSATARFVVAAPNGDLVLTGKTVSQFAGDINSRDTELINDYTARDGTVTTNVTKAYRTADTAVTNAYKAADGVVQRTAAADAQNKANAAQKNANANTAGYYIKKNTPTYLTTASKGGGNMFGDYGDRGGWFGANKGANNLKWTLNH